MKEAYRNSDNANRPMVYIASPYSGDVEKNVEKAKRYCRFVVDLGYTPIAPHIYFTQFLDDGKSKEREAAFAMNAVLLECCHEIWVFGDRLTEGMKREISLASQMHKRISFFSEDCKLVKN